MPAEILLLLAAAKATLLIGAALMGVACCRRAPASMRHAVLVAAMIGALLLPPLGALLPTFSPLPMPAPAEGAAPGWGRWGDDAILLLLVRPDEPSELPVRSSLRSVAQRWRGRILAVWLGGTALVLLRILADTAAAGRARSRALPRRHLAPGLPVLESHEIDSPVAVGLIRPAIMIPAGAAVGATALEAMISHELAHVRRRDCLTQLIARLACAAYWFNPVVWYAAHRIALERERACDDRVLASGADPVDYSRLLIETARRRARRAVPLHAASSLAQSAHLERRITGILDARASRRAMSGARHAALVAATGLLSALLAAFGLLDRAAFAAAPDPYGDPESERVWGIQAAGLPDAPGDRASPDGRLMEILLGAARREPQAPFDLVPDRARWALSLARDGRIIEPLLEQLGHPDWRIRGYAAWALGLSRDPRAVEPLRGQLGDPVWRLRAMAAHALREIGDPRATASMAGALDDASWQVRVEAAAYLGELREPRFRPRIEALRADPHIAVRLAAGEALAAIP